MAAVPAAALWFRGDQNRAQFGKVLCFAERQCCQGASVLICVQMAVVDPGY